MTAMLQNISGISQHGADPKFGRKRSASLGLGAAVLASLALNSAPVNAEMEQDSVTLSNRTTEGLVQGVGEDGEQIAQELNKLLDAAERLSFKLNNCQSSRDYSDLQEMCDETVSLSKQLIKKVDELKTSTRLTDAQLTELNDVKEILLHQIAFPDQTKSSEELAGILAGVVGGFLILAVLAVVVVAAIESDKKNSRRF